MLDSTAERSEWEREVAAVVVKVLDERRTPRRFRLGAIVFALSYALAFALGLLVGWLL